MIRCFESHASRVHVSRVHASKVLVLVLGAILLAPIAQAQDAAEILLRLDRLEGENRRLTGQVEELRFQLKQVEDQFKRFQTDSDTRFRDLEGARGGGRPAPSAATPRIAPPQAPSPQASLPQTSPPQTPVPSQKRSDAFDPTTAGPAPGAPRPLGAPVQPGAPVQLGSSGVATPPGAPLPSGALPPGGRLVQDGELGAPLDVTGQRRPPGPPPVAALGDAKSDFDFAKSLVDRGDYELAEGALRDYLRNHAKDRRAPEATFWLGESYLRRTRYREAAEHFLTVTSKFPNSARAPEAMLKLGISLRGLGANQEACGTFAQVIRKYPKASNAIRQAVEREKARAQC